MILKMFAPGILLLYGHPLSVNAPTIMDHVSSFKRHSIFHVHEINTLYGFPSSLKGFEFSVIVLHYTLFGSYPFVLQNKFIEYIRECKRSIKICFFQDEYQYCQPRFDLINTLSIDLIYTLLHPKYFSSVYYQNTSVKKVLPTLAGYVPEGLERSLDEFVKPFNERTRDVGYRARQLPFHMGRGAQEKSEISNQFASCMAARDLRLDISNHEQDRIYGDDWYRFLGDCRFTLGVEAGVSLFDFDGNLSERCASLIKDNPSVKFECVFDKVLVGFDGNINYRMISPRIFEAAALQVVPILLKGEYNGIIKADTNYIPIEKDYLNMNDVAEKMADQNLCRSIISNNLMLISRRGLTYKGFIEGFDDDIQKLFQIDDVANEPVVLNLINKKISRGFLARRWWVLARHGDFPFRGFLVSIYRAVILFAKMLQSLAK